MSEILLTTLNGRYTHSSVGLRYIKANLKELQSQTIIEEFVINENTSDIAEKILIHNPKIIGIGVYIWNAVDVEKLLEVLKKVSPDTIIVLGGPEVSYQPFRINTSYADYIIQGEGEEDFYNVCKTLLEEKEVKQKIYPPKELDLAQMKLPYYLYDDNDVAHRYIYVEASRGCPFSCEFCLSSIDKKVREFDIDELLNEFEILWQRGVRNYKFIDRTFNLNIKSATKILDYFLSKEDKYSVHFEVIPDNFPEKLKEKIKLFPPATLQLEIGIQTLKKDIAKNIKRNLNIPKIKENLAFLENETNAHIHLDLIIGLPGETVESFGENLDYLCSLSKSEIQVGILKKLSGTTLDRHDIEHGMIYSEKAPYEILASNIIPFTLMQDMKRFARFWDLVYNSGNFTKTFLLLVKDKSVYETFRAFSKWLFEQTHSTWQISLDRLAFYLFEFITKTQALEEQKVADILVEDILKVSGRKLPKFLHPYSDILSSHGKNRAKGKNKRQEKHIL